MSFVCCIHPDNRVYLVKEPASSIPESGVINSDDGHVLLYRQIHRFYHGSQRKLGLSWSSCYLLGLTWKCMNGRAPACHWWFYYQYGVFVKVKEHPLSCFLPSPLTISATAIAIGRGILLAKRRDVKFVIEASSEKKKNCVTISLSGRSTPRV